MYTALGIMSLARSNRYFRAAIEDDRNYERLVALRQKVLDTELGLVNHTSAPTPPTSKDDDIIGWLDEVAAADTAERAHTAKRNALTALRTQTEAEIASRLSSDPDRVLASLATQFNKLMSKVGNVVARLKGARTPAEAITAGTADAWRELADLRAQYDELRIAQRAVMVPQTDHLMSAKTLHYDDDLASDLALANLDEIFPTWRQQPDTNLDYSSIERRPWPLGDPNAELVWLASSDAQPWIPTLQQLDKLRTERRNRLNPAPAVIPGRPDQPTQKIGTTYPRRAATI